MNKSVLVVLALVSFGFSTALADANQTATSSNGVASHPFAISVSESPAKILTVTNCQYILTGDCIVIRGLTDGQWATLLKHYAHTNQDVTFFAPAPGRSPTSLKKEEVPLQTMLEPAQAEAGRRKDNYSAACINFVQAYIAAGKQKEMAAVLNALASGEYYLQKDKDQQQGDKR